MILQYGTALFHRLIYVNLTKQKSHVNTRLGTDHHQLIMLSISKDCSHTFLERSFIYVVPCEWKNRVNISGHQILIVSGRVLKQCYLHNSMDDDCKCIYYCYL